MKDVKKTTTKKTNVKKTNTVKHHGDEKDTVRVKEIKVTSVDNYEDENEEKKLIVVIAIAILIIIATVIGLLVGCERKEETPEKPTDEVITPDTNENKDDEEEEEKPVAVKVVKKTTTKKEEASEYSISYYYKSEETNSFDLYKITIKAGDKVNKFTPNGYENCEYYSDKKLSNKYNFDTLPNSNTSIYMSCSLIRNTVVYKDSLNELLTEEEIVGVENDAYVILSGENACKQPQTEENVEVDNVKFLGWSANREYTKDQKPIIDYLAGDVVKLETDLELTPVCGVTTVKYTNKIIETTDEVTEEENTTEGEVTEDATVENTDQVLPNEPQQDVVVEEVVLGVENTQTEENIEQDVTEENNTQLNQDQVITEEGIIEEEVTTEEKEDSVIVGYTKEEVDNFELPLTPEDVGLETPTYFVPTTDEVTDENGVKTIVDDTKEELTESEVKLSDVMNNKPHWYDPKVNDNVVEKDYVFVGWTKEETDPETQEKTETEVPEDWTPSETEDNNINANWEYQEGDQFDPSTQEMQ